MRDWAGRRRRNSQCLTALAKARTLAHRHPGPPDRHSCYSTPGECRRFLGMIHSPNGASSGALAAAVSWAVRILRDWPPRMIDFLAVQIAGAILDGTPKSERAGGPVRRPGRFSLRRPRLREQAQRSRRGKICSWSDAMFAGLGARPSTDRRIPCPISLASPVALTLNRWGLPPRTRHRPSWSPVTGPPTHQYCRSIAITTRIPLSRDVDCDNLLFNNRYGFRTRTIPRRNASLCRVIPRAVEGSGGLAGRWSCRPLKRAPSL